MLFGSSAYDLTMPDLSISYMLLKRIANNDLYVSVKMLELVLSHERATDGLTS